MEAQGSANYSLNTMVLYHSFLTCDPTYCVFCWWSLKVSIECSFLPLLPTHTHTHTHTHNTHCMHALSQFHWGGEVAAWQPHMGACTPGFWNKT